MTDNNLMDSLPCTWIFEETEKGRGEIDETPPQNTRTNRAN